MPYLAAGSLPPRHRRRAAVNAAAAPEALPSSQPREDYGLFVRFMHLASPYVVGHRGKTFVIVIPGEVIVRKDLLYPLLEDILLLHGLGTRLVLVCGASAQIDAYLLARGHEMRMVGAYRVTDAVALQGAIEAAGATCTEVAAALSRAPSLPMVRRHSRGDGEQMHFAPPVQVISGNYVTAKRRGVVGGVDLQSMGQVRFVQVEAINQQLQAGAIVLLTNIGVSVNGELLNCNTYDVATHAAVELRADKLLCMTGEDVRALGLPQYLPLDEAEGMIQAAALRGGSVGCGCALTSLEVLEGRRPDGSGADGADAHGADGLGLLAPAGGGGGGDGAGAAPPASPSSLLMLDLNSWQLIGFPPALLAAVAACRHGVTRGHLVDSTTDGGLLLELYTRDGTEGVCMIAGDVYEGIRLAEPRDQAEVAVLLALLVSTAGVALPFPPDAAEVGGRVESAGVYVVEREGKVLGCCVVEDHGVCSSGGGGRKRMAEVAALCIHPDFRRQGLGDSLLDFVEQDLRLRGFRQLCVPPPGGMYEYFMQRGFGPEGDAAASGLLPEARRAQLGRQQLFCKELLPASEGVLPAGKRIGF